MNIVFDIGNVLIRWDARAAFATLDAAKADAFMAQLAKSGPVTENMLVNLAKQKRIARAAVAFLYAREWMSRAVRFDVVEISAAGIVYLSNAFQTRAWG